MIREGSSPPLPAPLVGLADALPSLSTTPVSSPPAGTQERHDAEPPAPQGHSHPEIKLPEPAPLMCQVCNLEVPSWHNPLLDKISGLPESNTLKVYSRYYHKNCFKCSVCSKHLTLTAFYFHKRSLLCLNHFPILRKEEDLDPTPENTLTRSQQHEQYRQLSESNEYRARHNGEDRILVPSVICSSKGWGYLPPHFVRLFSQMLRAACGKAPEDTAHRLPDIELGKNPPEGEPVRVRISFAGWHPLRKEDDIMSQLSEEQCRDRSRALVVPALDLLQLLAHELLQQKWVFFDVNASFSESSMRSVTLTHLDLEKGRIDRSPHLERAPEVEVLNLSFTRASVRSIGNLPRFTNVRELFLDHCPGIKISKNVFDALVNEKLPHLELISLVGTSDALSSNWLSKVDKCCPKLSTVYFTRKPGTKALGWADIIKLQTMREPVLLPCGHIADDNTIAGLRQNKCAFDRLPFERRSLLHINPHITKLQKIAEGQWSATVCDVRRQALDAKALYHVKCGSFFNLESIKALQILSSSAASGEIHLDAQLLDRVTGVCYGCFRRLNKRDLRICFTSSATEEDVGNQFESIHNLFYNNHGVDDAYIDVGKDTFI